MVPVKRSRPKYKTIQKTRIKYKQVPYQEQEQYTDYETQYNTVYYTDTEYRDEYESYLEYGQKQVWGYNYYNTYCVLRTEPTVETKYKWVKKPHQVQKTKQEANRVPVTRWRTITKYESVPDGVEYYDDKEEDGYEEYQDQEKSFIGYKDKYVTKYKSVPTKTGRYKQVPRHDRTTLEREYLQGCGYSKYFLVIFLICSLIYFPFTVANIVFLFLRSWILTNTTILVMIIANISIGCVWSVVFILFGCLGRNYSDYEYV
jgi:hypothetical protein